MFKIFVVDDSKIISEKLKMSLKNGPMRLPLWMILKKYLRFSKEDPSLVIMDIGLPFFDGYYWTRKIRNISNVPIIFLSSKEETMNKIMAMEMGADDFVTKPFDLDFLTSKVKALLRRTYAYKNH